MIFELGAIALIGLLVWLASRRWPMPEQNRATKWRFVPLATSGTIVVLAYATFGAGLLLAPASGLMTIVSARRLASPRGPAFWLGASLNGLLMLIFTVWVVAVIYVEATG